MKRILFLTQGGPQTASSRYRAYQFLPYLRANGWRCTVLPGAPDFLRYSYFFSRDRIWKGLLSVFIAARRMAHLLHAPFADIVFVQKPLLPAPWPPLEPLLRLLSKKIVFDFDDAIFIAGIAPGRFAKIIRQADLVLAGNEFLAQEARKTARRVEEFPTVVDAQRFAQKNYASRKPLVIGWMGSPVTAVYLKDIQGILKTVAAGRDACIQSIGSGEGEAWSYASEVQRLQSFDIFIAPLRDGAWEQGKCGLKTLTAMSVGLPVIASAAGVHNHIIRDGENGFLAQTPKDWEQKLQRLIGSEELRKKMGLAARQTIVKGWDIGPAARRLEILLAGLHMPQA